MTVPACVSCQEKLSCADSALSITGNVIGILTFVVATVISIQVFLNSMRNANREIYIMSHRLESRFAEVQHLKNLLNTENDISGVLGEMLAPSIKRADAFLKKSEDLFLRISRDTEEKRGRFRSRARFVYQADELKKCIGEADDALGIIRGAMTGALLHVVFTYLRQTSAQMERMESDNHQLLKELQSMQYEMMERIKSDNHQNTYLLEELQSMKREMRTG